MDRLSDENGFISALAFDQRGALRKLMTQNNLEPTEEAMKLLKKLVAEELTPYASGILLDPEYGLEAARARDPRCGLLLAYEKTGYDTNSTKRLPDCLDTQSVRRLHEAGADALKFLLYYDPDGDPENNILKQAYIERIGSECAGEDIPFFLEIVTYDESGTDPSGAEYARIKPHKVIEAMKVFNDPRFGIDMLKVEVPVNMKYAEGFADSEIVYSKEAAKEWFLLQEQAGTLPYIYLSAGVSADLFRRTLVFAKEAGARFNGVLCGRATWADSVRAFAENGEKGAREWLRSTGADNIKALNDVLKNTAVSWEEKVK